MRVKISTALLVITIFYANVFVHGIGTIQLEPGIQGLVPGLHMSHTRLIPGQVAQILWVPEVDGPLDGSEALSLSISGIGELKTLSLVPISIRGTVVSMAFVPIPPWLGPGEVTILLQSSDGQHVWASQIQVVDYEFPSETIYLNRELTGIRTDSSSQRQDQSARLAQLLYRVRDREPSLASILGPHPMDQVAQWRVSSPFGKGRRFVYDVGTSAYTAHYGTDYAASRGAPIVLPWKGEAVMVEDRIVTGKTLVIEHFPALYSLYYHLLDSKVAQQETLRPGASLGSIGATGLATGPHLHWELRIHGIPVDPQWFYDNLALDTTGIYRLFSRSVTSGEGR